MFKFIAKKAFGTSSTRTMSRDPVFEKLGIKPRNIVRNLSVPELYESTVLRIVPANPDTRLSMISDTGALCAYSGQRTGRSPKDKRVVLDAKTKDEIWWGDVNMPISPQAHHALEEIAIDYLNNRPKLYVMDGYIGWDPSYRIKCRVLCARAYHALFMKNMMIKPTEEELKKDFADGADYYIFNAGEFPAPSTGILPGVSKSGTCVSVNLSERKMVILGTQYAGEMKKGLFGVMHYLMPKQGILSMHCSANEGVNGDTTLLFGLSGTGKTTLSADPSRKLIGDDEHCWSADGIFNIEGGCYAKGINLSPKNEPEIFNSIKFGAVLENINFYDEHSREVNYHDISITENTRVSYPLEYIPGAKIPAVGGHPKNIIFLTCDAFGVLPPVAKLTPEQAMYHFISGYTAKVAGTEMGIKEPVPTFSACYGEAFLPLHPFVYAKMLAEKMKKHQANCWFINTGWSGGKYGTGKRMSLEITRKIIDEIHNGNLENAAYETSPLFGLHVPKAVNGVNSFLLNPKNTWNNKEDFEDTLKKLAQSFEANFKKYQDKTDESVVRAGPKL